MRDVRSPQAFVGFAVGIAIGAALGVLFAPKSGEEVREYIGSGARDAFDDVVATTRKYKTRATETVNDAAERVMDATNAAKQAYSTAKST
jgi:gas vesicle protein